MKTLCLICSKEFRVKPYLIKKAFGKFCSMACRNNSYKRKHFNISNEFKKGNVSWNKTNIYRKCLICSNPFKVIPFSLKKNWAKFCSSKCFGRSIRKSKIISFCLICEKKLECFPSEIKKYCSRKCYLLKEKKVMKLNSTCLICNKNFYTKPAKIKDNRGKYCSKQCTYIARKGKPAPNKGKRAWWAVGDKNVNWKNGATLKREQARKSLEYKQWRRAVFKKDKYECVQCGNNRTIQADHIKPWSLFPELRFDVKNGRTLCESCHKKTFSYLNSKMNRESFLTNML